jgi:hypothetical protein
MAPIARLPQVKEISSFDLQVASAFNEFDKKKLRVFGLI